MSELLSMLVALLLSVELDADYLYMSCHHHPNIIAFDVEQESLITTTLVDIEDIPVHKSDLNFRGMNIQPQTQTQAQSQSTTNNILYIANSKEKHSFIGKWNWTATSPVTPLKYVEMFAQHNSEEYAGLVHPYAIDWYNNDANNPSSSSMLITTQDTQALLEYDSNGEPLVTTPASDIYPGAIAIYGPYSTSGNGVRGLAVDSINNLVFVAEETFHSVLVYDLDASANYENVINISIGTQSEFIPISLTLNNDLFPGTLFIGDNGKNVVHAIRYYLNNDPTKYELLWSTKSTSKLKHPAGIAINETVLFVVSQNTDHILQFDVLNGEYLGKFYNYEELKVVGENLLYVDT